MKKMTTKTARVKPERRLRHTRLSDTSHLITVLENGDADVYHVAELACELGGRAFRWTKLSGKDRCGEHYDARVSPDGCHCECKGHLRWGKCRHVSALLALASRLDK